MPTILIANPKGGCGKTTLATNLAGYLARAGEHVDLLDLDRQHSARAWLTRRPQRLPRIHDAAATDKPHFRRPARGSPGAPPRNRLKDGWQVVDSPAALRGERLNEAVKSADRVVVPVLPSAFDRVASEDFLDLLTDMKRVRKGKTSVAMVGMRVHSRSLAGRRLNEFLAAQGFPLLGCLRETQLYVQAAEEGTTLFDMPFNRVGTDLMQWQPILQWVRNGN
jgi:chromosome partitioning protein